ncbi:MAG TPA: UvrD-helicase domain-containing protein [Polyangiaceae bacterium]|nr:UvrD-helicase domain-containing protein [Polyangiaceae bacterium]
MTAVPRALSGADASMSPELNPPQVEAVTHGDGPLLVFAGAGSGKTRVITYRVAHLLAERRVPPYRILTVTFTNKAAGELRARLARLAGDGVTSELWVGTFHAVCARILRRHHAQVGLDRSFSIYDEADQRAVMKRVLADLKLDERRLPPKRALARIHAEKREGRGPAEMELGSAFDAPLREVFARYQAALATANAVDFEDLILHVMRLAEDPSGEAGRDLRARFGHVLVDEFQDTNLVQYRLVRALAAATQNLCVVGDDDQSIYGWRGADVRLIRGFQRDFPGATVVKLEQNYRSTGHIVAAALGVIEPSPTREPKRLWTAADLGDRVRVVAARDERDEAAFVVRTIQDELRRGTDPRDVAVFYRVHAQSRVLEEALRGERIPYQVVGGMKFFERAEVKDLIAYLRLVDNPRSDADLGRVINVPARGIGDKTVQRLFALATARGSSAWDAIEPLLRDGALGTAAKARLVAFRALIEELRRAAESCAPDDLAELVLERSGYRAALGEADTAESDARLENLAELVGSIAEYVAEAGDTGEPATLGGYLERVSLVTAVDGLKDVPSVSLMTVHAAKGLEFVSVVLTGMEEEVFPYRGLDGDHPEELEEERRLAYVAVTRARERLAIVHAAVRTLFGDSRFLEPSRFLADLPPAAIVHERTAASAPPPRPRGVGGGRAAWPAPVAVPPAPPRVAPGERVVDTAFFDDVSSTEASEIRPGLRVRHRRFGEGVVEGVEGGPQPVVVARFAGFGVRKIRADFLELA